MSVHEDPDVLLFRQAAERFCGLLEARPADVNQWVEDTLAALAQLYACGHTLPDFGVSDDAPNISERVEVGDAEWRRVYSLVQEAVGVQSGYWAYFDPSEPPDATAEPVFGDLSDDLADIYRDIKPGLRALEAGLDAYLADIVCDWKFPLFGSHWGVHAVSAMRAMHPLAFLRGIHKQTEPDRSR